MHFHEVRKNANFAISTDRAIWAVKLVYMYVHFVSAQYCALSVDSCFLIAPDSNFNPWYKYDFGKKKNINCMFDLSVCLISMIFLSLLFVDLGRTIERKTETLASSWYRTSYMCGFIITKYVSCFFCTIYVSMLKRGKNGCNLQFA